MNLSRWGVCISYIVEQCVDRQNPDPTIILEETLEVIYIHIYIYIDIFM